MPAVGELLVVGGLGELVGELGGQGVADPVAGHGRGGAQGDEQVGLAGPGVADEAERQSFLHPVAGGEGVDDGGVDAGVGVEVEGAQRFLISYVESRTGQREPPLRSGR